MKEAIALTILTTLFIATIVIQIFWLYQLGADVIQLKVDMAKIQAVDRSWNTEKWEKEYDDLNTNSDTD